MTPRLCLISEQLPQSSWEDKELRCPGMARTSDAEPPGIPGLPSDLPGDYGPMRTQETSKVNYFSLGTCSVELYTKPGLAFVGAPFCLSGHSTSAPLLPMPLISAIVHL